MADVPTPTPEQLADPNFHQSAADKPVDDRWPIPPPPVPPEGSQLNEPAPPAPPPVDPTA